MEYRKNIQLKDYNSFKTEAIADLFCSPGSISELKECLTEFRTQKKLVIGGGCNLFFTKKFDGLVIYPRLFGVNEIADKNENNDEVFIEAMASEDWDQFVAYCVHRGYAGLENLSLIPGTVGASPIQNIGAYGAEVKDVVHQVKAIDLDNLQEVIFTNQDCEFKYRDSIFKQTSRYIVTSVIFRLHRQFSYTPKYAELNNELAIKEHIGISDVREAVIKIRRRKLPDEKELPNCGSFFKNPCIHKSQAQELSLTYPDLPMYDQPDGTVKTSAAFLIDKSGYKGMRIGYIGTYATQPLIIVNYGSADGNDIVSFMHQVQDAVKVNFGVALEPEVRIF